MWTKLEPGARKCLLIWMTAGEKTPERMEEQDETERLKEAGEVTEESGMADQLRSLSEPSDRMDSLDEAGVGNKSAEHVGLVLSTSAKQP